MVDCTFLSVHTKISCFTVVYNCDRLSIAFDQVQHVQIDDGSSQGEEDAQEGAAHKLWKTCVSFVTVFVWSGAWGFGVCM